MSLGKIKLYDQYAVFKSYFGKILLLVILNLSVIKQLLNEVEQDMRNY